MDVRCGRCGTEYEFDDALVSERGTTVKCTNCGHQFKVRPAQAGTSAPERWVVRTSNGRELVYTSLRDLQKGIAQRQVGPEDMLARGNQPQRALGSIAELEPFFQSRPVPPRGGKTPSTLSGVAPPANTARVPVTPPLPAYAPPPDPPTMRVSPRPEAAPAPKPPRTIVVHTPPPPVVGPAQFGQTLRSEDPEPPTLPRNPRPTPPDVVPVPAIPVDNVAIHDSLTPTPSDVRESMRSYGEIHTDPRYVGGPHSRRARSRWIAGVVVAGVLILFGATLGRQYVTRFTQPGSQSRSSSDARVATMLETGNRLIADGDIEGAKEQYDKASALAEKDPAVLAALARLETIRADSLWLKLRLLDPADTDLVTATHRLLGARVGKAAEQVQAAKQVAPEDPVVLRAEVDVLRMKGELAAAREKVAPIAKNPSEPDNAYVLAALDLAEPSPGWSSVIDRLRTAAAAERDLGRARAALLYALARSGQIPAAESELAKIESLARPHPLGAELKAFLRRFEAAEDGGADAEAEVATVDPASLPKLDTSHAAAATADETTLPGDFRGQLTRASAALKRGDLAGAENLYNAVLAKQPGNTEAIAGLGDVARRRKDPEKAGKLYDQVLEDNPSYLPALVGSADQKWDSGDRKGALALYRRVLEQAGAGSSYGQHAAARLAQGEGAEPKAPASAGTPSPPASASAGESKPAEPKPTEDKPTEDKPPAQPKPKPDQPNIDTTDLPGMN